MPLLFFLLIYFSGLHAKPLTEQKSNKKNLQWINKYLNVGSYNNLELHTEDGLSPINPYLDMRYFYKLKSQSKSDIVWFEDYLLKGLRKADGTFGINQLHLTAYVFKLRIREDLGDRLDFALNGRGQTNLITTHTDALFFRFYNGTQVSLIGWADTDFEEDTTLRPFQDLQALYGIEFINRFPSMLSIAGSIEAGGSGYIRYIPQAVNQVRYETFANAELGIGYLEKYNGLYVSGWGTVTQQWDVQDSHSGIDRHLASFGIRVGVKNIRFISRSPEAIKRQSALQQLKDKQRSNRKSDRTLQTLQAILAARSGTAKSSQKTPQLDLSLDDAQKYHQEAVDLIEKKQYRKALAKITPAVQARIKHLGKAHVDTAISLGLQGKALSILGQDDTALDKLTSSISILEKNVRKDDPRLLEVLFSLAIVYNAKGQPVKARKILSDLLTVQEQNIGPNHPTTIQTVMALAGVYGSEKNVEKAKLLYQRALNVYKKISGTESALTAQALSGLALVYQAEKNKEQAEKYFLQAYQISKKVLGKQSSQTMQDAKYLAKLYKQQMRFRDALPLNEEVYQALQLTFLQAGLSINNSIRISYLKATEDLVDSYLHLGQYKTALPLAKAALKMRQKLFGAEHYSTLSAKNELGILYHKLGEYVKAEPLLTSSLKSLQKQFGAENKTTLLVSTNLAKLYQEQGRHTMAERLYQFTYEAAERNLGPNTRFTLASLNSLGIFYMHSKQYAKAEQHFKKALKRWNQIKDAKGIQSQAEQLTLSMTQNNLGLLYIWQERYEEAVVPLTNALKTNNLIYGATHPNVISIEANFAILYAGLNQPVKADAAFKKSIKKHQKMYGIGHPETLAVLRDFLPFLVKQKRIDEALKWANVLLLKEEEHLTRNFSGSEKEKQSFFEKFDDSTNYIFSLHLDTLPNNSQMKHLAFETWLRRKGRILDTQAITFTNVRRNLDKEGQALLDEYATLQKEVTQQVVSQLSQADIQKQKRTEARLNQLEQLISQKSNSFKNQNMLVTLEDVQAYLPKNSALLQYAIYTPPKSTIGDRTPQVVAYILYSNGRLVGKKVGSLTDVEARLKVFRDSQARSKAMARWLYIKLIKNIVPDIAKIKHVFISPDGPLNLIPFEALIDSNGETLLDNISLSYLSTGKDLIQPTRNRPQDLNPPVIFANPNYGKGKLAALPGTQKEADLLAKLYPSAQFFTKQKATVNALRNISKPQFLHIATHGFAHKDNPRIDTDNNPMVRSGLYLADANNKNNKDTQLLASEAATLDLDGTRLVVLSACESGLGDTANGEGVYGMRRALTLAGAKSQVVSLWEVSDEATYVFMQGFYTRILKGQSIAKAMQQTKLEMKNSVQWSDPAVWAPFVLTGEWR